VGGALTQRKGRLKVREDFSDDLLCKIYIYDRDTKLSVGRKLTV